MVKMLFIHTISVVIINRGKSTLFLIYAKIVSVVYGNHDNSRLYPLKKRARGNLPP